MSAILANIYMLELDNHIMKALEKFQGLYRRSSDYFIIVISINMMT